MGREVQGCHVPFFSAFIDGFDTVGLLAPLRGKCTASPDANAAEHLGAVGQGTLPVDPFERGPYGILTRQLPNARPAATPALLWDHAAAKVLDDQDGKGGTVAGQIRMDSNISLCLDRADSPFDYCNCAQPGRALDRNRLSIDLPIHLIRS